MINKTKKRINEIITHNIEKLDKEIEDFEQKMYETLGVYGVGGAYSRQEKARDKRIADKKALEQMLDGMGSFKASEKVNFNYIECKECGAIFLTTRQVPRGYHECPCCNRTTYSDASYKVQIELTEDGKAKLDKLKGEEE